MAMNPLMVRIAADAKGLQSGLNQAIHSVESAASKMESAFKGVGTALAGLGATAALKHLVDTNKEFQKLSATLKVVTGSSAGAKVAMDGLQDFATKTPYKLDEVVGSFIKLKALGLDPSLQALESYGNTASALGKDLNQFIEAVADAATGEFERLKEFGIKSAKQGDQVSFTFQGVTTTIANSADKIEEYLQKIGKTQFAGAMKEQMNTLGGAFSNLEDQINKLEVQIGEGGLNQELFNLIGKLTDVGKEGDSTAKLLGQAFGGFLYDIGTEIDRTRKEIEGLLSMFAAAKAKFAEVQQVGDAQADQARGALAEFYGVKLPGPVGEEQGPPVAPTTVDPKSVPDPFAKPKPAPKPAESAKKRGGGKSASEKAADEAARHAKAIQDVIANLKFEQDQLARTDVEQEVYNNLKHAGVDVNSLQGQEINKLTRAIYAEQEAQKKANEDKQEAKSLIEESLTPLDQYAKKLDKIADLQNKGLLTAAQALSAGQAAFDDMTGNIDSVSGQADEAKDIAKELGLTFASAFEEAISGGESFRNILDGIAQDLLKLGTRKLVTEPLLGAMDGLLGGLMGGLSGAGPSKMPNSSSDAGAMTAEALLGTVTNGGGGGSWLSMIGGLLGGMFADGGRPPMGKVSLVGEEGPELFVPDSAGQVIPNDFFQNRGPGGGSVSMPITVNIAKGTPDDARRAAGQIAATAAQRLETARRRNG